MSEIQEEAERSIAQVKELFGPPALLQSEDEGAYYKLMLAFALAIRPRNAFGLMQLNEMTTSAWRREWFRRQQMMPLDRMVRGAAEQRLRREGALSKSKTDTAMNAEDLANIKDLPEADRRTFELETKIDDGNDVDELLKSGKADADYNKALNAALPFIDRIDQHITTETRRVNEAAQWLIWYREICQDRPAPNIPAMIEAKPVTGTPVIASNDSPLAPTQPDDAVTGQPLSSIDPAPTNPSTESENANGLATNPPTGG